MNLFEIQQFLPQLLALTFFVFMDIFTGFLGAAATDSISSTKMRKGLFHKGAFYCVFVLAVALELTVEYYDFGYTVPAVTAVTGYIVLTEVISICENVVVMNPELKDTALMKLFDHGEK